MVSRLPSPGVGNYSFPPRELPYAIGGPASALAALDGRGPFGYGYPLISQTKTGLGRPAPESVSAPN